jgi:hypothetical protein
MISVDVIFDFGVRVSPGEELQTCTPYVEGKTTVQKNAPLGLEKKIFESVSGSKSLFKQMFLLLFVIHILRLSTTFCQFCSCAFTFIRRTMVDFANVRRTFDVGRVKKNLCHFDDDLRS